MAKKTDKNNRPALKAELVSVDELLFDIKNPRIVERELSDDQDEILLTLWRDMAVDEIAFSIASNGYFFHEPVFATRASGKLIVIEGNRRLAAVKILRSRELRNKLKATNLPKITTARKKELSEIPVVVCKREDIWHYIGFKHVHGPQPWESYSKAKYIARVHKGQGIELDNIAKQIGDTHSTVRRLYRALMVIEEAEKAGVFDRSDRYKKRFMFSHLYTGLERKGVASFIGISADRGYKKNPVPNSKIKNLGDLLLWLYGSKGQDKPPLIKSQNPDLKTLDETLLSKNGIVTLRMGLPLSVAYEASKGDEQLFREALVKTKIALGEVKKKVTTGFKGESDFLEMAEDISRIAKSIFSEMKNIEAESGFGKPDKKRK